MLRVHFTSTKDVYRHSRKLQSQERYRVGLVRSFGKFLENKIIWEVQIEISFTWKTFSKVVKKNEIVVIDIFKITKLVFTEQNISKYFVS